MRTCSQKLIEHKFDYWTPHFKGDSAEEEDFESDEWNPEQNEGKIVWDQLEDREESIFVQNMEEAEQIEEEETLEGEKRDAMDLVHSDFPMERLRVKLYTIEEESSEEEEEEEGEEDDLMGLKRLQGLSELQRYFLLLAGQHEFSQQC